MNIKYEAVFEKKDESVYISHLDLMTLFIKVMLVAIVLVSSLVNQCRECLDQTLDQRGDAQHIPQVAGHVTHTHLDGAEVMVRTNVPPDLANRIDEPRVDQVVDQPDILAPIPHQRWQAGCGEPFHNLRAVGLEPRIALLPKGAAATDG